MSILEKAASAVAAHEKVYGSPTDCFDLIAKRWSLVLGRTVTPAQVALMLIDLKLARLTNNPTHEDSAVDVAGYAACLGEIVCPSSPVDVD